MSKTKKVLLILAIPVALLLTAVGFFAWSWLEYGDHPIIAHKPITIILPFAPEDDAGSLIPMGETIAHPIPHGHPGIDFGWDHSVPIIAAADGVITKIQRAEDMGEPVWYITQKSGTYKITYKELDEYETGLAEGSKVKRGDRIGKPHGAQTNGGPLHFQIHWEFAYNSLLSGLAHNGMDRLCPLTYFDSDSLTRITRIWDSVPATDQFKAQFPDICSGDFHNHNQ